MGSEARDLPRTRSTPLFERPHLETLPFLFVVLVAVALEPVSDGTPHPGWWWLGLALVMVPLVVSFLRTWSALLPIVQLVLPLVFVVGVALMRHGSGGIRSGLAPMMLLAALWVGLRGTREQLATTLAAITVALLVPLVAIGEPGYPAATLRTGIIVIASSALVGVTTQLLRERLGRQVEQLARSEEELRTSLDAIQERVERFDIVRDDLGATADLRSVFVNLAGRRHTEGGAVAELLSERLRADGRLDVLPIWLHVADGGEPVLYEVTRGDEPGGGTFEVSIVRTRSGVLATWRDVTAERRQAAELRDASSMWQGAADIAVDAVLQIDGHGVVTLASPSVEGLLGISAAEATGRDALDAVHPDDRELVASAIERARATDARIVVVFRPVMGQDDPRRPMRLEAAAQRRPGRAGVEIQVVLRDVSLAEHERRVLLHRATHDDLTSLRNRAGFIEDLDHLLRVAPEQVFVVYFDLDRFKPVNDDHGHAAGDEVLSVVAARTRTVTRDHDLVARLGGDEFAIAGHAQNPPEHVDTLIGRLTAAVAEPIRLSGNAEVTVGASIGQARGWAGCTPDELLAAADEAMYRAKSGGTRPDDDRRFRSSP